MECEGIARTIIGCAYRLYNTMGFGFLESVYEKRLVIELRRAGLKAGSQKSIPVAYAGQSVGDFTADLVLEEKAIVGLKPATGVQLPDWINRMASRTIL